MGLKNPLPEVSSPEQKVLALFDDIKGSKVKSLMEEMRGKYKLVPMFLESYFKIGVSRPTRLEDCAGIEITRKHVCMTDSERNNRELIHARSREDHFFFASRSFSGSGCPGHQ